MHNGIEACKSRRVSKDDRPELPPINLSVRVQDLLAKGGHNLPPRVRPGPVGPVGQLVSTDPDCAQLLKDLGHLTLPGPDASGEADDNHPPPVHGPRAST